VITERRRKTTNTIKQKCALQKRKGRVGYKEKED